MRQQPPARPPVLTPPTLLHVAPDVRPSRRRILMGLVVTALVFVLGMLTVTGLEALKGSSLTTGESGTSVGRVISGGTQRDRGTQDAERTVAPSTEPTSTAESNPAPTDEASPSP